MPPYFQAALGLRVGLQGSGVQGAGCRVWGVGFTSAAPSLAGEEAETGPRCTMSDGQSGSRHSGHLRVCVDSKD